MAHHKSAKKRIRSDARKNMRNRSYLSTVRTAVKKFKLAAGSDTPKEELAKLFKDAQSMLHKAATKGIIHRNNASRRVGRLSALMSNQK